MLFNTGKLDLADWILRHGHRVDSVKFNTDDLHRLIWQEGSERAIKHLIDMKIDVNSRINGMPPVLIAALNNKIETVSALVAANADIMANYEGASCLDVVLRNDLLQAACVMVKLKYERVNQHTYDKEFKKGNRNHQQLRVMEIILLKQYIERRTKDTREHGFFGGDSRTNKLAAAEKRLQQLLGNEVEYTPTDLNALSKSDLGDITKFSKRRK